MHLLNLDILPYLLDIFHNIPVGLYFCILEVVLHNIPDAVAEQMRMLNMCRPEIKKARDYIVHDGCEVKLTMGKNIFLT